MKKIIISPSQVGLFFSFFFLVFLLAGWLCGETRILPMMAPRIPLSGYHLGHGGPVIPVSFPNQPDDEDGSALGVFQPAPNYAVDFHFRPRTGSGVRFLFGQFADDAAEFHFRPALATPVTKRRCAASSDPASALSWIQT